MKKYLLVFISLIFGTCVFVSLNSYAQMQPNVGARDIKSGKWVPEYGGGSRPFRCACAESLMSSQCRVGDITSNISLCE